MIDLTTPPPPGINTLAADPPGNGRTPSTEAWSPAPLFGASLGIHASALLALAASPPAWPWVLAALAGNHLVLTAAGLWPRGGLLGANLHRLSPASAARREVALTFDDGPDPLVTPEVLRLLKDRGMVATFFCVGARARAHPALVRAIAADGHDVENHSDRHLNAFTCLPPGALLREIGAAQTTLGTLTGRPPRFFRPPMGFRSPLLDPVLARLGLRHVSWTRRGYDAVRGDPALVLRRLLRGIAPGDVLLLHDGAPARTPAGRPVVLEVLPGLLDRLQKEGLRPVPFAAE